MPNFHPPSALRGPLNASHIRMMHVGALLLDIGVNFKQSFDCLDHELLPPRDDGRFTKIVKRNTPE